MCEYGEQAMTTWHAFNARAVDTGDYGEQPIQTPWKDSE